METMVLLLWVAMGITVGPLSCLMFVAEGPVLMLFVAKGVPPM